MANSDVASATYTIQQQVATPTFSPAGRTYAGVGDGHDQRRDRGATIHYTTDGSTPTTVVAGLHRPDRRDRRPRRFRAMAAASGMANSAVASATYTIQQQVATPTFSPAAGTYAGSVTVTISDARRGATIHYTTDGSTPTTSSPVYTGPITLTQTTTIRAMATASGMANSAVASATYTIQQRWRRRRSARPAGTYVGSVTVTISDATTRRDDPLHDRRQHADDRVDRLHRADRRSRRPRRSGRWPRRAA